MKHWANAYVGKKWTVDGYGPECFNCWGLFWWVSEKHYGRQVPKFQISPENKPEYMRVMLEEVLNGNWRKIEKPLDGCAVAMGQNRNICHVGVFLDVDGGRVLHAVKDKGVLCETVTAARIFYPRLEFYTHVAESPHN